MHELLRIGQHLSISAPRNLFALDEQAPRSLLLAGALLTSLTSLIGIALLRAAGHDRATAFFASSPAASATGRGSLAARTSP